MLLCAVFPRRFLALRDLEEGVPEVGRCIVLLYSDFLGSLYGHLDPLSLPTKVTWESTGTLKAARPKLCHLSISVSGTL